MLDIRVAATADEARAALADGYEPVECAFGSESVVGPLGLDHHGTLADHPPVCRQALTHTVDARRAYVVAGSPDTDASLCIAIASGILGAICAESVAHRVIGLVATSDVGQWCDLSAEGRAGAIILAWHARQRARRGYRLSSEAWKASIRDWAELLALPEDDPELSRARESEAERVRLARTACMSWPCPIEGCSGMVVPDDPCTTQGHCDSCGMDSWGEFAPVLLIESPVMGADVWYHDRPQLHGYVAWQADTQLISISLRPGTARGDGLLALRDLIGAGWGGRPEVVASPRNQAIAREDAVRAAELLAERIDEVARG